MLHAASSTLTIAISTNTCGPRFAPPAGQIPLMPCRLNDTVQTALTERPCSPLFLSTFFRQ